MRTPTHLAGRFLDGLFSTTPATLAAGVCLGIVLLIGFELAVSSGRVWQISKGYLLSDPYDDWTNVLWQVNRFDADDTENDVVFFFGGSSSREAVTSDDDVSNALSTLGKDLRFHNFGTRNQSIAESVILLDNLPRTENGLVIFGLQPTLFRYPHAEIVESYRGLRFPLPSPTLKQFLDERPEPWKPGSTLNLVRYRALVSNYIRLRLQNSSHYGYATSAGLLSEVQYINHLYTGAGPMRPDKLERLLRKVSKRMETYGLAANLNFELLQLGIRLARDKGYRVMLVEMPRNPVSDDTAFAPYTAHFLESVGTLSVFEGVPFVELGASLGLQQSDFVDHVHLVDRARPHFQKALVRTIVETLEAD